MSASTFWFGIVSGIVGGTCFHMLACDAWPTPRTFAMLVLVSLVTSVINVEVRYRWSQRGGR